MASSLATSRFADIVSVEEFIEEQENENTRKKTEQNIALLKEFLTLKAESRAVEEIPPDELNSFISEFIITVRKKDDNEDYEHSPLHGRLASFERYLKETKNGYSIIKDVEFEKARRTNKTSASQHAENSATAVLSDGQQSQQAMSLLTGAVIHRGQFIISINSLNQSPKLAVQEPKVESSPKRYK